MKGSVEPWFKHRFWWCCFLLVRHQSLLLLFVMCKKQISLKPCALFFFQDVGLLSQFISPYTGLVLEVQKTGIFELQFIFLHLLFLYTPKCTLFELHLMLVRPRGSNLRLPTLQGRTLPTELSWSCQCWSCVECESNGRLSLSLWVSGVFVCSTSSVGSTTSHGCVDEDAILFTVILLSAWVGPFLKLINQKFKAF